MTLHGLVDAITDYIWVVHQWLLFRPCAQMYVHDAIFMFGLRYNCLGRHHRVITTDGNRFIRENKYKHKIYCNNKP